MGRYEPTFANRAKAVAKIPQRQLAEMPAQGAIKSLHGGVTNRKQVRMRPRRPRALRPCAAVLRR